MNQRTGSRITRVGTVAVPVADQDRALAFYVGELGFEKRRDLPFGPGRWIEVAPPGAATTIALVPESMRPPGAGIDTGIRLRTDDAAGDHANLLARGVDADAEVMRMDPAGNRLVIGEGD
jgi:catechol 2,3-dioxygenase-like lactoylglutathione lyase family enzyme